MVFSILSIWDMLDARRHLAMSCSYAPKDPCIEHGGKSKDEELCRTKYSIHAPCSMLHIDAALNTERTALIRLCSGLLDHWSQV